MDDRRAGLRQFEITGAPFTGDPTKWDDLKAAVCTAANSGNVSFLLDYGTHLFKFRQQHDGDFDHEAARRYFNQTDAPMSQISLKIQVVKATISDTAAHYEALDQDAKRLLQQHNVTVYIKKANQILLEALRKHFLLKKQHALTDQMQRALDSPQVRKTVAMDFSDWQPAWTDWQVWQLPAARAWADMLDVFQGRERSNLNSFWATMRDATTSCDQQLRKPSQYSTADSAIEACLNAFRDACGNDPERMIDRLHAEMRMALFHDLAKKQSECCAWDQAIRDAVKEQRAGNFTAAAVQNAADTAVSLIAQGRGGYQNGDAAGSSRQPRKETREAQAMKTWVNQQIDKKIKGDKDKKTAAPRELCTICGKTHAGGANDCWHKEDEEDNASVKSSSTSRSAASTRSGASTTRRSGTPRRARGSGRGAVRERKALQAAATLREDSGSESTSDHHDHNEDSEHYVYASLNHDTARTSRRILIAKTIRHVHPDTQAEVSISNDLSDVDRLTGRTVQLKGVVDGAALTAQVADLVFSLRTSKGGTYRLAVTAPGLYHSRAHAAILAHQDLEDAGLVVDYTKGHIYTPTGEKITMTKRRKVWAVPLATAGACHALMSGASSPPEAPPSMVAARKAHQCSMHAGATSLCHMYDIMHGAGFGKATKAQLREAAKSCVACALGKGVQDYRPSSAARHTCTSRVRFAQAPQVRYVAKWLHDDPDALALLRQADKNALRQDAIERALPQLLAEIELDNTQLPEVRAASLSTPPPSRSPPVAVNPSEVRPTARRSRTADETLHLRSARRNLSPPPTRLSSSNNAAESSLGEPSAGEPATSGLGEQTRTALHSRRARAMAHRLGIRRQTPQPGDEWLLDWAVMGQETLGGGGEQYALVVMDAGSDLVFIKPTRTRDRVWEHLEEVVALWGRLPQVIRCDNGAEFVKNKLFKAWRRKHFIALRATQPHRHKMQGKVENLIRNMKQRCRATRLAFGGPARLWPELTRMFEAIHNVMPRQVPKHHTHAGKSPQAIYQPVNLHYDVDRLWHPPGCHVVGKLAKEDPLVTDTSNGPRGVEGIFLGCDRTTPRVRMYVPAHRKFMEFRDVTFFDNRFPFRDGLLDNTNFSQNDIQAMHKPLRPEPTRSSPRVTPRTTADSDSDSETRPSDPDASSAAGDPIHETADATLARFVATRRLRLHLPAVSFYEDGWDVECSGTTKHQGQHMIIAKHITCTSNPALTRRWKNRDLELPVSRPQSAGRDVSLRRAIQLTYPDITTMQQLVGVCKIQTPFPATEGERQAVQADKQVARQNSVRVKGREIPATTKLVALDDASLARAIVNHAKPLQLDERELVQPTGVRRNKGNITIEYKFLEPEERATKGDVGSIPVSHKREGDLSVRDVLNVMHDFPDTLEDIGLHGQTESVVSKAHVAAWKDLLLAWKDVGPHTTSWTSHNIPDDIEDDAFRDNPFSDSDLAERWALLADIDTVSKEEGVDLSWIDLTEPDPRHRGQAMRNPRLAPIWQLEEDLEMKGLWERGCLRRVRRSDLPADARVISSRFHYKIKRSHAGDDKLKVKRLKVRLVVQGQHMSKDKGDFDNAFSPVPHLAGIRAVMSTATAQGWGARSVDFKQGFIQSDLPKGAKPIYISPPPGVQEEEGIVYQVLRPLYGMPHSGRCLHVTWSNWLKSEGFTKVGYEGSMWAKKHEGDHILIATHVDDSIVTGSNDAKTNEFLGRLKDRFDVTIEEGVSDFLGMEWERDIEGRKSRLHQKAFIEKLLRDYGYWECQAPPATPMAPKAKLSAEDQPEVPDPAIHRRYRSMVGAIGWLSNGTRPDVSYAYSEMSKHVQRPGLKHMEAAEYCLRYLSGTVDLCIEYRADADQRDGQTRDTLWGWVDADFAADMDTRRSHTGYIIMLNGGPVSWKSTRQKSVSLSTAESEWYAASEAGKEIIYLRYILHGFGFEQKKATPLYEDSRAVICMAENPVNRKASRHIDTRRHWIGEQVEQELIKLVECKTDKMVADALTKSLPGPAFKQHRSRMMGANDAPYRAMMCSAQIG